MHYQVRAARSDCTIVGAAGLSQVDFVFAERGAKGGDVDAVGADGLVEEVAGDVELLGPVGDVGGDFGLDLVGVHGNLVAVLGLGVLDGGCGGDVIGHAVGPHFNVLVRGMRVRIH